MATMQAVRHHTRDEVEGYIREALAIVTNDYMPDDLQGIAFSKAIELLSGKLFIEDRTAPAAFDVERMLGKR